MTVFFRWWRKRRDEWSHSIDRTAEEGWRGCAEWVVDMLDAGMDRTQLHDRIDKELGL